LEYDNPFHNDNREKDETFINKNNPYYKRNENGIEKENNEYDNNDNRYTNDENNANPNNINNEIVRFGLIHRNTITCVAKKFSVFTFVNNNNNIAIDNPTYDNSTSNHNNVGAWNYTLFSPVVHPTSLIKYVY